MFKNYFVVAIRNILRQKVFSAVIILSLMTGIAVFGLIFLYVHNEFRYDRFNKNYKRIYRMEQSEWALTGTAYGPEVAANFPEVLSFARVSCYDGNAVTVKIGADLIKMENLIYADSSFFRIFSFRFIEGNPDKALTTPFAIVLTESEAKKLFRDEDPMNKTITINNRFTYTVTGVIRDVKDFHLKINAVSYFPSLKEIYNWPDFLTNYGTWNYYTYFLLKDRTDVKILTDKINAFYSTKPAWKDQKPAFFLRPLKDVYYTTLKYDFPAPKASRTMLVLFMAIGVFVLLIACVNFINLTTARASVRAKEIGLRKVIGADRKSLISQFLGEAVLFSFISAEFSLVLMELFRPSFSNLVQREILIQGSLTGWFIAIGVLLPVIVGVLAGLYPSLYLTRFRPIVSLKEEKTRGKGSLFFRRSLIVFQFTISIFLIAATFTVFRQLDYVKGQDLGITKDPVIKLSLNDELNKARETFRQMLSTNPAIRNISFSTQGLGNVSWQESMKNKGEVKQYTYLGVEPEFLGTMGLEMAEGKFFNRLESTDSAKCVLNQEMVRMLGLKSPVGQVIGEAGWKCEIIGVVKDFHFNSLHNPIGPLLMSWQDRGIDVVNIRVSRGRAGEAIAHVKKVWNDLCPDYLFEYKFVDESYNESYSSEDRLARLFMYLSILAILIASIGLFGLASFLAEQRTKEIGLRKSLGSSTAQIVLLFVREYARWIFLSGVIALPVSYFVMNRWLNQFAYHTRVGLFILLASWMLAIVVALLTVSYHAMKTARANPADALRYE